MNKLSLAAALTLFFIASGAFAQTESVGVRMSKDPAVIADIEQRARAIATQPAVQDAVTANAPEAQRATVDGRARKKAHIPAKRKSAANAPAAVQ